MKPADISAQPDASSPYAAVGPANYGSTKANQTDGQPTISNPGTTSVADITASLVRPAIMAAIYQPETSPVTQLKKAIQGGHVLDISPLDSHAAPVALDHSTVLHAGLDFKDDVAHLQQLPSLVSNDQPHQLFETATGTRLAPSDEIDHPVQHSGWHMRLSS